MRGPLISSTLPKSIVGAVMVSLAFLRLAGILLLTCCIQAAGQTGSVRGRAEDPAGFDLPFP